LFYLEVMDFEEGDPSEPIEHTEEEPLIPLHAIASVRTDDTMQVQVQVGEKEFTALINTGSTHNFFRLLKPSSFSLRPTQARKW
jgi:hypothetical protein